MKAAKRILAGLLIAVLIGIAHSVNATAIPIQINLPPFQVVGSVDGGIVQNGSFIYVHFNNLDGTPMNGQQLSLDLVLPEFIRIFTETQRLGGIGIQLYEYEDNFPPGVFSASAYLTDKNGRAITAPQAMQFFKPFLFVIPNVATTPTDFYGLHIDETLPNDPGVTFSNGLTSLIFGGAIFGLGPNTPTDIVPDSGGTFGLLTLALAMLFGIRWLLPHIARSRVS